MFTISNCVYNTTDKPKTTSRGKSIGVSIRAVSVNVNHRYFLNKIRMF